jgi:Tfp pilus assembly protein PilF
VVGSLALLAVAILWRILTLGLADLWAESAPDRALYWRPDHPDALREGAEERLDAHEYAAANTLAKRSIQAYPLDGRNYRDLGLIADLHSDTLHAATLFQIAAKRSPRDLLTHQMLAEYALKSGDLDQALVQFDLILRLDWTLWPDLLPRMVKLAEFPVAESAFAHALELQPHWRTQFLQTLASQAHDPDAVDRLYRSLDSTSDAALSAEEMAAWIDRQIRDRNWQQAYSTWASSLPLSQRVALGNLFDGDFAFPPSGGGFGWQISPVVGADVRTTALAKAGAGKTLTIDFDGTQITFRNVSQLLVLSPGHYVLHGKAQADALDTGRGLQWVLTCAEGQQQVLASSPLLVGTQPWQGFAVAFEVPANQCGGQWLRLQMGAPDRISGHAAYAALSVERVADAGQSDNR